MQTISAFRGPLVALIAAIVVCAASAPAEACTRALYVSKDGTVIVGRSMDWGEDMHSNMWVLPRGMQRDGRGGKNTISWVSKYGSLITSAYDIGTADGMNEKGLVVNELALVESDYGKPAEGATLISLSTWPQYVLDNFATVAEAVADLEKETFRVQTVVLSTGRPANMHLVISDATGDSAVFEYVAGQAGHPPRQAVPGDDQFAHLRQAVGDHGVLEGSGRHFEVPARHLARGRPIRAHLLPVRCAPG